MAQDSANVTVGSEGEIYIAAVDETVPTGMDTPGGNWEELGFIDENGVTFTVTPNIADINAWQSEDPVRKIVSAKTKAVSFAALEWTVPVIGLALGGGTDAFTDFGTYAEYSEATAATEDPRSMIVDFHDGDEDFRFIFEKGTVTGDISTQLTRTNAGVWTITYSPVRKDSSTPAMVFRTNSPEILASISS